MKYNDGKYHIENIRHEYLGGYSQNGWTLVNVFGEHCRIGYRTLVFNSKEAAQKKCDKLNICPEGGILTNLE